MICSTCIRASFPDAVAVAMNSRQSCQADNTRCFQFAGTSGGWKQMAQNSSSIRSGLPDREMTPDPFLVLKEISCFDELGLTAKGFMRGEWWEAAEAAAQACCLHQRWRTSYSDHVFLLSVDHAVFSGKAPSGELDIRVSVTGQTKYSASYDVHIMLQAPAGQALKEHKFHIQLTVGHKAYDMELGRERLSEHYRGYWQWLTKGLCDPQ